jgi:hypothetical protein
MLYSMFRYSIVYMCKYWLYEQNGRSKLFNLDSVWVTLEYGLFFLNCYEWCKFPFTQWSVDIRSIYPILSIAWVHNYNPNLVICTPFSEICHQSQTVNGCRPFSFSKGRYQILTYSFYLFHTRELYSVRCKKCKHTRQKKITIFRGKEKKHYFYIHRRPILYQTENHDH